MKVLLLEIPEQHMEHGGALRTIENELTREVEDFGGELMTIRSVEEADKELRSPDAKWMVIHHGKNFKEVDFLRAQHPGKKFAAYTGLSELGYLDLAEPGTYGYKFKMDLLAHYDLLLGDLDLVANRVSEMFIKLKHNNT